MRARPSRVTRMFAIGIGNAGMREAHDALPLGSAAHDQTTISVQDLDESLIIQLPSANHQVPDLILVHARVLARSASRPRGLSVYSVVIAASVGYRLGLLRIEGSTWSVASLFGFG